MFVSSARLEEANLARTRAEAVLEWTQAEAARLIRQVEAERAEVRRLTDIIIQMKAAGREPAPQSMDEVWEDGPYNAYEPLEQKEKLAQRTEGELSDREARAIEDQLLRSVVPDD